MRLLSLTLLGLTLALACSHPADEPAPDPWQPAMKGWEVYSYRVDGEPALRWTILLGTNRLKSAAEVFGVAPIEQLRGARGSGADALEAELARFAPTCFVGWNLHPPAPPAGITLAWPTDEAITRIEERARAGGVELHLAAPEGD